VKAECDGATNVGASKTTPNLSSRHLEELVQASAIDPAVIVERGYRTLAYADRAELAHIGITLNGQAFYRGLLLPMYRATGEQISAQFKPAKPVVIRDRSGKYPSPRGQPNCLDVHPRNQQRIGDIAVPCG
jgi:hypothetical protein